MICRSCDSLNMRNLNDCLWGIIERERTVQLVNTSLKLNSSVCCCAKQVTVKLTTIWLQSISQSACAYAGERAVLIAPQTIG